MDSQSFYFSDISSEIYLVGGIFILSLIVRKLIGIQVAGVLAFISIGIGMVALYNTTLQIPISTSDLRSLNKTIKDHSLEKEFADYYEDDRIQRWEYNNIIRDLRDKNIFIDN